MTRSTPYGSSLKLPNTADKPVPSIPRTLSVVNNNNYTPCAVVRPPNRTNRDGGAGAPLAIGTLRLQSESNIPSGVDTLAGTSSSGRP